MPVTGESAYLASAPSRSINSIRVSAFGSPGSSRMRLRQPSHPHAPVTLSLRAEVTQPGSTQVAWVLSLQCQMTEQEPVSLAYDVGRMVGGAIGQTLRPRAF